MRLVSLVVLLACLLGSASSQATSKSAKPRGKLVGKSPSSSIVGKLRLAMLTWYCAEGSGHAEERPCQNFHFMQKLRKTDDAGRKKLALQSREGYLKMYRAYCAQPAPANPAVCSNESLKKVYDNMAKSIQTTKA